MADKAPWGSQPGRPVLARLDVRVNRVVESVAKCVLDAGWALKGTILEADQVLYVNRVKEEESGDV